MSFDNLNSTEHKPLVTATSKKVYFSGLNLCPRDKVPAQNATSNKYVPFLMLKYANHTNWLLFLTWALLTIWYKP